MRTPLKSVLLLAIAAVPAYAQEAGHEAAAAPPNLLSPNPGLMFWTLVIFAGLLFVLAKFAFGPITKQVEAREKALEDAIEGAKRDRDAAAALLEEQRKAIETSRVEAQKIIADGRAVSEKMRHDLLEQTRREQSELLERARRDIDAEKDKAIVALRREAVDLAIAGASKVVEQNLDTAGNRKLVESYLSSIGNVTVRN